MKKGSRHSEESKTKLKESHLGKRRTGWEAPCLFCGKIFYAALHRKKQGRGKYCSRKCWLKSRTSENSPSWRGENHSSIHTWQRVNGTYKLIYCRDTSKRMRPEHIVIAEQALGRKLKRGEIVHHIDMNPLNNSHSNLLTCSNAYHSWLHQRYAERFAELHLRPPSAMAV